MSRKIMHTLFLSCLKATEIIEKGLHFKISWKEKLQLKVHKMMCDACTRYEKQSLFLDKAIKSGRDLDSDQDIEMARTEVKELKERINKILSGINEADH